MRKDIFILLKNDSEKAVLRIQKEMYVSLTNYEDVFLVRYDMDLLNGTFQANYEDFLLEDDFSFSKDTQYARIVDVSTVIPENYRKETYSTKDLKEILEILNDVTYEIKPKESSSFERKYR